MFSTLIHYMLERSFSYLSRFNTFIQARTKPVVIMSHSLLFVDVDDFFKILRNVERVCWHRMCVPFFCTNACSDTMFAPMNIQRVMPETCAVTLAGLHMSGCYLCLNLAKNSNLSARFSKTPQYKNIMKFRQEVHELLHADQKTFRCKS
jgi:hypothetical protein